MREPVFNSRREEPKAFLRQHARFPGFVCRITGCCGFHARSLFHSGKQLLPRRQEAVLHGPVLPRKGLPILVQGPLFGAFQSEIGYPVISASDIGQFGGYCHASFAANLILCVACPISYKNICLFIISRGGWFAK